MNRKLRTRLLAIAQENTALSNATTNANMQKVYYDRGTKPLPKLEEGSTVRIRNIKNWDTKGQVVRKLLNPRSYIVQTETEKHLRRNCHDLLATKEKYEEEIDTMEDDIIEDPEPPPKHQQQQHLNQQSQIYQTKSGRTVRPPTRLNLQIQSFVIQVRSGGRGVAPQVFLKMGNVEIQ